MERGRDDMRRLDTGSADVQRDAARRPPASRRPAPRTKPGRTALRRMFTRMLAGSKGRFLSIVGLMALGSFALVGLLVAGPDMRATSSAYFDELSLADVTVISDLGLDADDVAAIDAAPGASAIEYGYFKDVTIEGSTIGVRVMSATREISQFELVDGRMPEGAREIALDAGLEGTYELGDTIVVDERSPTRSPGTRCSRATSSRWWASSTRARSSQR